MTDEEALALDIVSPVEPVGFLRTVDKPLVAPEHLRARSSGDQGHRRASAVGTWLGTSARGEQGCATLAKADDLHHQGCLFEEALYKAAVDKPAVADVDPEMRSKRKRPTQTTIAQENSRQPGVEAEASLAAGAAVPSRSPRDFARFLALRIVSGSGLQSRSGRSQTVKGRIRACVPVRVKYCADAKEPTSAKEPVRKNSTTQRPSAASASPRP